MNAAIRAIVRTVIDTGLEAVGVQGGFEGLMAGRFVSLGPALCAVFASSPSRRR